jgi:hypothetical protein
MTDEPQTAKKITAYLDASTANLKAGTAYRLQQARAAALARLTQTETAGAIAVSGNTASLGPGGHSHRFAGSPVRWLGIVLIAAAALFGWQQWRAIQQVNELQELDSQILSSDLPIDAYLDRGFQNWLKASYER